MIYYGSKISDNLSETPEGFLICHNVPIARTGYQDYLGSELIACLPDIKKEMDINPDKIYKVYRSKEEVFAPATIASFEGKPFTDNHPSEMVTTSNIDIYGKGHIQNVRKGDGEYRDMLIADIICTDEGVSSEIKSKAKREVSCGYNLVIKKGSKGYEQTQIRGNHLALVENARAGQKAAIQDNEPDAIKQKKEGENKMIKSNIFYKMFAAFAKDAEPEELAQAGQALSEMGHDEGLTPPPAAGQQQAQQQGGTEKEIAELKAGVAQIMATLQQLVKSDQQVHQQVSDEDKLDALEKLDDGEGCGANDEEGSDVIEPEKEEKEEAPAMDAAVSKLVKAMRPSLLAIEDPVARGKAVDAFCAVIKDSRVTKKTDNGYDALIKVVNSKKTAKDSAAKPKTMDERAEEQVAAINKFNAQNKKEDK